MKFAKAIEFSLCIGYNAKKGKYTPMQIPEGVVKMSKLSLAGAWKLRGEFMDVTAERYNEVLRKMDAAPVRATLPAFLKLEDLSEEEQAEFLKTRTRIFT